MIGRELGAIIAGLSWFIMPVSIPFGSSRFPVTLAYDFPRQSTIFRDFVRRPIRLVAPSLPSRLASSNAELVKVAADVCARHGSGVWP
jgi:hypothetical protein